MRVHPFLKPRLINRRIVAPKVQHGSPVWEVLASGNSSCPCSPAHHRFPISKTLLSRLTPTVDISSCNMHALVLAVRLHQGSTERTLTELITFLVLPALSVWSQSAGSLATTCKIMATTQTLHSSKIAMIQMRIQSTPYCCCRTRAQYLIGLVKLVRSENVDAHKYVLKLWLYILNNTLLSFLRKWSISG